MYLEFFFVAYFGYGVYRFCQWVRGPKALPGDTTTVEERLNREIAQRQKSLYRDSAILCAVLMVVWLPILLFPRGFECRPMGQAVITFLILLFVIPVSFIQAVLQLIETWPKLTGWIAIAVSLLPIAVYLLSQWLILDVHGIIYEE